MAKRKMKMIEVSPEDGDRMVSCSCSKGDRFRFLLVHGRTILECVNCREQYLLSGVMRALYDARLRLDVSGGVSPPRIVKRR